MVSTSQGLHFHSAINQAMELEPHGQAVPLQNLFLNDLVVRWARSLLVVFLEYYVSETKSVNTIMIMFIC